MDQMRHFLDAMVLSNKIRFDETTIGGPGYRTYVAEKLDTAEPVQGTEPFHSSVDAPTDRRQGAFA